MEAVKMKKRKLFLVMLLVLPIISITCVEFAAGFIIFPPTPNPTVYLAWVTRPSDKSKPVETSVSITWKAKSSFSGRGYVIKKNGAEVQSGSWSSYSAITYTYTTPFLDGTDELECKIYDSRDTKYDYCNVITTSPDSDYDGISDAREIYFGTDPNNPNDPLGQNFEDQSFGENPDGWIVQEYAGYSEISIANSLTQGLVNSKSNNILKMEKFGYYSDPYIRKEVNYDLSSPLMISFEAGYYSKYNDEYDNGYLDIWTNGISLIKIEMEQDSVYLWENPHFCMNVYDGINYKQIYKFCLILQIDNNGYVDYSLYIDGAYVLSSKLIQATNIDQIFFGLDADYETEFYLDNIYYDYVEVGSIDYNIPFLQAIPLCWFYAPEVDHVLCNYRVGDSRTIEISSSFKVGGPLAKAFDIEFGIDIITWYRDVEQNAYYLNYDKGDDDRIVHIRYEYTYDKIAIKKPGTSEILMEVIWNCQYIDSKYHDLNATNFENEYGWLPEDPRTSGITKLGSHTTTDYEQENGFEEEYILFEEETTLSYSLGFSIGIGLSISIEFSYSEEVRAEVSISVDREFTPFFDYGHPTDYEAYLGIQPYIVKPLGTM